MESIGRLIHVMLQYGLPAASSIQPYGSGLINSTWIIDTGSAKFILQRINDTVFKQPNDIGYNIRLIADYLSQHYPAYFFVTPLKTVQLQEMAHIPDEGYFRLYPFVPHSHTVDAVSHPSQAYEAAKQFGRFTKLLAGFPCEQLLITLPDFHNLSLRYTQFEKALAAGNSLRMKEAAATIEFLQSHRNIVSAGERIINNPAFKKRVTHHDTKISNVLFDENNKGLCVIDLDTVMPGYFISDVGDMLRTYVSPVSEEETDFRKIDIRIDYFKAVVEGYLEEMNEELSKEEKLHFIYAGKYMIYMQALRFLTDYLNNDVYYGSNYEGHNLMRANNQSLLLQNLITNEAELEKVLKK